MRIVIAEDAVLLRAGLTRLLADAGHDVVAEALTNIARHSGATRAAVSVARQNGHLTVEVTDDGIGGADTSRGTGLAGLLDRVQSVDGTLRISSPAGGPTILTVELPCGS